MHGAKKRVLLPAHGMHELKVMLGQLHIFDSAAALKAMISRARQPWYTLMPHLPACLSACT